MGDVVNKGSNSVKTGFAVDASIVTEVQGHWTGCFRNAVPKGAARNCRGHRIHHCHFAGNDAQVIQFYTASRTHGQKLGLLDSKILIHTKRKCSEGTLEAEPEMRILVKEICWGKSSQEKRNERSRRGQGNKSKASVWFQVQNSCGLILRQEGRPSGPPVSHSSFVTHRTVPTLSS